MRFLFPLLLVVSVFLSLQLSSCEPKENLLSDTGQLEFAAPYLSGNFILSRPDSVLFDTVFTRVGTVTKRLWVYNHNARAVRIEQISLGQPAASPYSLIINGDEVNTAAGLTLRGNDSLLILVKARLGETNVNTPFLLTNDLKFRTNGHDQTVRLVAYGQNAYFHANAELGCDEVWKADKPHVLVGVTLVKKGCTLRILPGARIYAHAGAVLWVQGTLLVNEPADFNPGADSVKLSSRNIVRFLNDRREPEYANVPGQWLGVVLDAGSHGSRIRYAEIKNSVYGVVLNNPKNQSPPPDLTLNNCVIRNINGANVSAANPFPSPYGAAVFSVAGTVTATNCLFTNCGQYAILGLGGTKCELNYCTVANYAPGSSRETESLYFVPQIQEDGPIIPVSLTIRNSIIWGPTPPLGGAKALEDELLLIHPELSPPAVIEHTLLRTKRYAAATGTPDKPAFDNSGNLLNKDPKFLRTPENYGGALYDYHLDAASPAANQGIPSPLAPRDLLNKERSATKPDLGAFERKK